MPLMEAASAAKVWAKLATPADAGSATGAEAAAPGPAKDAWGLTVAKGLGMAAWIFKGLHFLILGLYGECKASSYTHCLRLTPQL